MIKIDKTQIGLFTFLLSTLPEIAFANAGSPMMWFGFFHLIILNALIGWAESDIINKFKIQNRPWLIIIGNYVSMLFGLWIIAPQFSTIAGNSDFWGGHTNFGNYKLKGFVVGMVSSYLATLIIEFPFFYFAVKNNFKWQKTVYSFIVA